MLENILGSKTKVRILRFLLAEPGREFSQQDIASSLGLSTGSIHPAINQLLGVRMILSKRVGRSRTIRINRRHPLYSSLRTLFRREATGLVAIARKFADSLPEKGLDAVVLFGSVARGGASPRSDVDVLVVLDSPTAAEDVQRIAGFALDRFDVNVSPLVMDAGEVGRRLHAFDPLMLTIAREGQLLRGKAKWLER